MIIHRRGQCPYGNADAGEGTKKPVSFFEMWCSIPNYRRLYRQGIKKKDKVIEGLKKELKMLDLVILALKILRQLVNMLRLNCSNQAQLCRL